MSSISIQAKNRLLQVEGELIFDGYRRTGKLGDMVLALKHTNGNRITLIANEENVAIIKNGRLVKSVPICTAAATENDRPTICHLGT